MKYLLPALSAMILMLSFSCKKDQSDASHKIQDIKELLSKNKVNHIYVDTSKSKNSSNKLRKSTDAINTVKIYPTVTYTGSGGYSLNWFVYSDYDYSTEITDAYLQRTDIPNGTKYSFKLNGYIYYTPPSSFQLPAGTYRVFVVYNDSVAGVVTYQSDYFTIQDQPIAPSGMVCCYRYYNPTSGQHLCTSDWEELGSLSHGFKYEKVVGYMYPSLTSDVNLKPVYRYYDGNNGDHLITGIQGPYNGFIFESIIGYVGISQTATLTKAMNKYYSGAITDHFICAPPEVPLAQGYNLDGTIGYMQ